MEFSAGEEGSVAAADSGVRERGEEVQSTLDHLLLTGHVGDGVHQFNPWPLHT